MPQTAKRGSGKGGDRGQKESHASNLDFKPRTWSCCAWYNRTDPVQRHSVSRQQVRSWYGLSCQLDAIRKYIVARTKAMQ